MVYLAIKLRRQETGFENPTILVVTDRIDLDNQISSTFIKELHQFYKFIS
jgi:type I restriction enzyme R subunit